MTTGYAVEESGTERAATVAVPPNSSEVTPSGRARRVPLIIPSAQEYYWHFEWQQGEREAAAEREAGDVVRFDSEDPADIIRWLHEPDEDEE